MPMIRTIHNKENPFIQLNKAALWDKDLSLEAVGLWARLLSRPDDWQVSVAELSKSCDCNPKKIYKLLKELCEAGYAHRFQEKVDSKKSNKKKVFSSWITYVFEFKIDKKQIKEMFPHGTFEHADNPLSGKRETTNNNSNSSKEELEITKKERNRDLVCTDRGSGPKNTGVGENQMHTHIPRIKILHPEGDEIDVSREDIFRHAVVTHKNWTAQEIEYVWKALEETKQPIRDVFKYAEGVINKIRKQKAIENYAKKAKEEKCNSNTQTKNYPKKEQNQKKKYESYREDASARDTWEPASRNSEHRITQMEERMMREKY